MNAVELENVTKSFRDHIAVDDLSLAVPEGAVFGFIGPNGSGKTTTLRMIMNILFPDRGVIAVLGQRDTRSARDRVSYLPEERGLYKKMTVRRLLQYYGALKAVPRASLDSAIHDWLERMELAKFADKKIEALSKGMSQKVQFIAAVVSSPKLLILDEPFSGLDPVGADVLSQAVLELKQRGATIVFSTHDMASAERMCDRICMIFRGRKVLDGTLDEIQSAYGQDTVRVRTSDGAAALRGLAEVESVRDYGNLQELRLQTGAQHFLQKLCAKTTVLHFEVARPSLHDIFVRIAKPNAESASHA
jgi:ABC-2 type transport system ATP-binding protein